MKLRQELAANVGKAWRAVKALKYCEQLYVTALIHKIMCCYVLYCFFPIPWSEISYQLLFSNYTWSKPNIMMKQLPYHWIYFWIILFSLYCTIAQSTQIVQHKAAEMSWMKTVKYNLYKFYMNWLLPYCTKIFSYTL